MEKHELIGNTLEVIGSKNDELVGIKGNIIDESKNTLTIVTTNGKKKRLIKEHITFKINDRTTIEGKNITFRPEDRTKRK
jgi:ribonuclease P protein subunit POP4